MRDTTDLSLTVFGSYKSNSIGDIAILISLLDLLFSEAPGKLSVTLLLLNAGDFEDELEPYPWSSFVAMRSLQSPTNRVKSGTVRVSAARSSKLRTLLRNLGVHSPRSVHVFRDMRRFLRSLPSDLPQESDGLIIGGGNLLMDLFPNWPIRPYSIEREFHRANKPVVLAGVGAFPIRTWCGKFLLWRLAGSASQVWVRDRRTEAFLNGQWRIPAIYHPDFAFSFPLQKEPPHREENRNDGFIAVNIAPVYGQNWPYQEPKKYEQFIDGVAQALFQYAQRHESALFSFFDTNYPTDRPATLDLIDRLTKMGILRARIIYADRRLSAEEIARSTVNVSLTLVTRLHAGILALRLGSPLLAIAYQPKVNDVLESVGLSKSIVGIDRVDTLSERIREVERVPESFRLSSEDLGMLDQQNRETVRSIITRMSAVMSA